MSITGSFGAVCFVQRQVVGMVKGYSPSTWWGSALLNRAAQVEVGSQLLIIVVGHPVGRVVGKRAWK
ncbi:hypothetical protein [Pasteuria penetrans]|uniref:hypothetical protein n=1 Tax=Pasteuria penetrans TaxID=86005 RepID=UPI0011EF829E|nr:hypothetical protein [Pasteuria penetrans]